MSLLSLDDHCHSQCVYCHVIFLQRGHVAEPLPGNAIDNPSFLNKERDPSLTDLAGPIDDMLQN